MTATPQKSTLTSAEAAMASGISHAIVKEALRNGVIKGMKVGRIWHVDRDSFEVFRASYQPRGRGFNDYRIENDVAYLALTDKHGQQVAETLVDAADLPRLIEFGMRWCVMRWDYPYAELRSLKFAGKGIRLHRFLLDAPEGQVVDHLNGNTLDNRRCNLRVTSQSQNTHNIKTHRDSKTGVKNMCWDKTRKQWRVYICANGVRRNIGYFDDRAEAERQAQIARDTYHGYRRPGA